MVEDFSFLLNMEISATFLSYMKRVCIDKGVRELS